MSLTTATGHFWAFLSTITYRLKSAFRKVICLFFVVFERIGSHLKSAVLYQLSYERNRSANCLVCDHGNYILQSDWHPSRAAQRTCENSSTRPWYRRSIGKNHFFLKVDVHRSGSQSSGGPPSLRTINARRVDSGMSARRNRTVPSAMATMAPGSRLVQWNGQFALAR